MKKDLHQMTREIIQTFKEYAKTGTNYWNYRTATIDLSYQVGSLSKRILQLDGDRYKEHLSEKEIRNKIADELVDILANSLLIAHDLDINLCEAWENMHKSDRIKISKRTKK